MASTPPSSSLESSDSSVPSGPSASLGPPVKFNFNTQTDLRRTLWQFVNDLTVHFAKGLKEPKNPEQADEAKATDDLGDDVIRLVEDVIKTHEKGTLIHLICDGSVATQMIISQVFLKGLILLFKNETLEGLPLGIPHKQVLPVLQFIRGTGLVVDLLELQHELLNICCAIGKLETIESAFCGQTWQVMRALENYQDSEEVDNSGFEYESDDDAPLDAVVGGSNENDPSTTVPNENPSE